MIWPLAVVDETDRSSAAEAGLGRLSPGTEGSIDDSYDNGIMLEYQEKSTRCTSIKVSAGDQSTRLNLREGESMTEIWRLTSCCPMFCFLSLQQGVNIVQL